VILLRNVAYWGCPRLRRWSSGLLLHGLDSSHLGASAFCGHASVRLRWPRVKSSFFALLAFSDFLHAVVAPGPSPPLSCRGDSAPSITNLDFLSPFNDSVPQCDVPSCLIFCGI